MQLPPLISNLNDKLKGMPDSSLTLVLLAVSGLGIIVALFGPPVLKAAVAAWFIAP